jgi:hypothetical protein
MILGWNNFSKLNSKCAKYNDKEHIKLRSSTEKDQEYLFQIKDKIGIPKAYQQRFLIFF